MATTAFPTREPLASLDPHVVCEWFIAEARRLFILAGQDVTEMDEAARDPEDTELFTHALSNLVDEVIGLHNRVEAVS